MIHLLGAPGPGFWDLEFERAYIAIKGSLIRFVSPRRGFLRSLSTTALVLPLEDVLALAIPRSKRPERWRRCESLAIKPD